MEYVHNQITEVDQNPTSAFTAFATDSFDASVVEFVFDVPCNRENVPFNLTAYDEEYIREAELFADFKRHWLNCAGFVCRTNGNFELVCMCCNFRQILIQRVHS